ncbi:MAG TPA: NAD-dependent epimerase/dehydratase family protein [Candidatus Aminicenantes bacterium]|nr:NAD-dependent epimerase/dehydratase family protein [Candidatus Aminicenantes bacterium]HRY65660.1 NAD-dependent epimerase/dehydratase family protein [Candidatus Aminicenantes bacterium]HRZ72452.1 NAD-dependent epimerase/dehydratase family protein [Candidatus Aminicenantes bacterium]
MRALVTGSSGFIGGRLAAALARDGHDVVCLVRPTSRTSGLAGLPVRLAVGDLRDPGSLDAALAGREVVFHAAAVLQAVDDGAFDAANAQGTRHLVQACLRAEPAPARLVLVSSIAAGGPNRTDRPGLESDEPRPVSAYGRSKLAAERAVLEASGRLPAVIVRPPNVIGPGSKELERTLGLLRRRIVPAVGDERPRTSLVDVDDLVEALLLAAADPRAVGQTYYVTDGRAYAWPEIIAAAAAELGLGRLRLRVPYGAQMAFAALAESAARLTGRPPALTREIVRSGREYFWVYDGSKIVRELGFQPRYGMQDSVRRMVKAAAAGRGGGRR